MPQGCDCPSASRCGRVDRRSTHKVAAVFDASSASRLRTNSLRVQLDTMPHSGAPPGDIGRNIVSIAPLALPEGILSGLSLEHEVAVTVPVVHETCKPNA